MLLSELQGQPGLAGAGRDMRDSHTSRPIEMNLYSNVGLRSVWNLKSDLPERNPYGAVSKSRLSGASMTIVTHWRAGSTWRSHTPSVHALAYKTVMKIGVFGCGSASRATSRNSRGEFIAASCRGGSKVMTQVPAMPLVLSKKKKEGNVMKKLLGVIAIAAVAFAVAPAQAAKKTGGGGCSAANLEHTETAIENMADGDSKVVAQKEISAAQDSMLGGKMGACGMHLNKAMHATAGK